jgi:hypothetical protein
VLEAWGEDRKEYAAWYKLRARHAKQVGKDAKSGYSDTEIDALAVHEAEDKKDHSTSIAHIAVDKSLAVDCLEAVNEQIETEIKKDWKEKERKGSEWQRPPGWYEFRRQDGYLRRLDNDGHVPIGVPASSPTEHKDISLRRRYWDGNGWMHLRDKGGALPLIRRTWSSPGTLV